MASGNCTTGMEIITNTFIFNTKVKTLTTPSDVRLNLNPAYNRKKCVAVEKDIEDIWKRRCAELPSLFNETKFRLHSTEVEANILTLNLGITCYRDFQGTNLSKNVLALQSQGLCEHDDSQAYLSDALGVGALVLTSDEFMVLLYRSKNCGEDIKLWDRPGGHAEPKKIAGNIAAEDIDVSSLQADAVIRELFSSVTDEVISEVNIPADSLGPPGILGIHRSNLSGGKPNVEFLIKCSLTASEVKSLYHQGCQAEAYESENILLLPIDNALNTQTHDLELWNRMAAGAKGLLYLYNMYRHRFLL